MHNAPPTLTLLARDFLLEAQERIEVAPSLTLWLALAQGASPALEEVLREVPTAVLDLSGAEACDAISHLLQTAGYPDLSCLAVPAPAPTVSEAEVLQAAALLGQAWDLIESARLLLGASHDGRLCSLLLDVQEAGSAVMEQIESLCAEAAE